jgi:hypothetical protein
MARRVFGVVALLALSAAGCATQSGFDARMQALVGQPPSVLIERLGQPTADFVAEGRHYLLWTNLGTPAPATIGPGAGFGLGGAPLSGQGIASGPLVQSSIGARPVSNCSVRFEIMDGRAVGYLTDGMGCDAVPPR